MKTGASLLHRLFSLILVTTIAILICSGCGKKEGKSASVVTWPELVEFDKRLREAETLAAGPPSADPTQMFPSETNVTVFPTKLGYRK